MRNQLSRILIVDDDPSIREALDAALRATYTVHTVATGDHACMVLRNHPIAAIVLDAILGKEDGLVIIESFRVPSVVPFLTFTGFGTEALAVRTYRLKASDYLRKPINLHDLHAGLARLTLRVGPAPAPRTRARRWVVERSHSWLNRFRKLLVRVEETAANWESVPEPDWALIAYRQAILTSGQALRASGNSASPGPPSRRTFMPLTFPSGFPPSASPPWGSSSG